MSADHHDLGDLEGALQAFDTAPTIMATYEGADLRLSSANAVARAFFSAHQGFGRPAGDGGEPHDEETLGMLEEVFLTGRPTTSPAWPLHLPGPGGTPVEVLYDLTVTPWFASDGSVRGVLAHGLDVTERVQRDDDLLRSVITLQDALLPEWLPVLPGVEIAGRYLVAQSEVAAGGDWYDAVGLGNGRVALVVGDVVGHGVPAAALMGQLRTIVHERLQCGCDLAEVMTAVDGFACQLADARAATVCVVVLDTGSGELEYCTAGHPPPLVVPHGGGPPRYLVDSGAAPLATSGRMTVTRDRLQRGDLLLLYTDGLLERPGRSRSRSTVELGEVVANSVRGPEPVELLARGAADHACERALDELTRTTGYSDDITLLVAELIGPTETLRLDLEADDRAADVILDEVADWMGTLRVRELDHIVVQHAVNQLVDNLVANATSAHPAMAPRLRVEADLLDSGDLRIQFCDSGPWQEPGPRSERGRGMRIARGMVDRLLLEDEGRVATLQHRLSRPARMLTGVAAGSLPQVPPGTEVPFEVQAVGARLRLGGPMDPEGLADLDRALADAVDNRRVVLDLGAVTHLPGAAVQLLYLARQQAADRGHELVLFAPAGTPAQHVLDLVKLPYALRDPDEPGSSGPLLG